MVATQHKPGYKMYLSTWLILLAVSLVMILIDTVSVWRTAIMGVLLVAMLFKAGLISANFMHLRSEKTSLIVIVAAGILATGAVMFLLMAADSAHIFERSH